MKKNIIHLILLLAFCALVREAKCQYYGCNQVQFETYTDSISNEWLIDCYNSGDTMSFRLRGETDKGFKSIQPYINFKNQAIKKGVTVKFTYCVDLNKSPEENLANINGLKNAGCFVPDLELGNEYYSTITPKLSFPAYRVKIQPYVNLYTGFTLFIPLAPRPLNSSINGGRRDHQVWNDSAKLYIQNKPQINVVWHLYFNSKDCPILADTLTPQAVTPSYNAYLDDYYFTLHNQLYQSTLLNAVTEYLNTNFAGKKIAFTEIGIIGGDPDKGNTSNIRNTYTYSEWVYYLLKNLKAYEIDIHAGISLTGIIQPTGKYDLIDGFKNKKRFEYYSLYLTKFKTEQFAGAPYYYSSIGSTAFMTRGSVPTAFNPLGQTGMSFGVFCHDSIYTVTDTTYSTIQVANPLPGKCGRFFYSLFHGKECTISYHTEQQMILTTKQVTTKICK